MRQLEAQLRNSLAIADADTKTLVNELRYRAAKQNDTEAQKALAKREASHVARR